MASSTPKFASYGGAHVRNRLLAINIFKNSFLCLSRSNCSRVLCLLAAPQDTLLQHVYRGRPPCWWSYSMTAALARKFHHKTALLLKLNDAVALLSANESSSANSA